MTDHQPSILVGCERSGRLRDALRKQGHAAWSCDLEPTEGDGTYHIQGDIFDTIASQTWDMMIVFPPCTYLTRANAWRWNQIAEQREQALGVVRALLDAPIPRIALENPPGAIGTHIRHADQYIQPWMFEDPYQKKTGLWLRNLPPLVSEILFPPLVFDVPFRPAGVVPYVQQSSRRGYGGDGSVRNSRDRSRTFPGIAQAMARQWGHLAGRE